MDQESNEEDHGEGGGQEKMIKVDATNSEMRIKWDGTQWKDKSIEAETNAFLEAYKRVYPNKIPPNYDSKYAELFVCRYLRKIAKTSRVEITLLLDDIEGKDLISFDFFGSNGNIEVKAINNYLTRNDTPSNNPDTSGTIPFEIFHSWPNRDNNLTLDNLYAGWLLSSYNYLDINSIKREHGRPERAETPGLYAFVLMATNHKPFACIVFEDIRGLLNRLYLLCPDPKRWGIPYPDDLTPATDKEYWKQFDARNHYDTKRGGMRNNMWHVPLRSLYDLATVTMIKNDLVSTPEQARDETTRAEYHCGQEIAEGRYRNLLWVAQQEGRGNLFDPEGWTAEETEIINGIEETTGVKVSKRNYFSFTGLVEGINNNE